MKIEYTLDDVLRDSEDQFIDTSPPIPVVRLAEVEKLIQAAEWAMKILAMDNPEWSLPWAEAKNFLASVAAWRKGQEEGKVER